jgi:hypothetical protein
VKPVEVLYPLATDAGRRAYEESGRLRDLANTVSFVDPKILMSPYRDYIIDVVEEARDD